MWLKQHEVTSIGHPFTAKGLKTDLNTIKPVTDLPAPVDVKGVPHFIRVIKCSAQILATAGCSSRIQMSTQKAGCWVGLCRSPVASIWNVETYDSGCPYPEVLPAWRASDTSTMHQKKGLGVVLLQEQPITYASKSLSEAEQWDHPNRKITSGWGIWSGTIPSVYLGLPSNSAIRPQIPRHNHGKTPSETVCWQSSSAIW